MVPDIHVVWSDNFEVLVIGSVESLRKLGHTINTAKASTTLDLMDYKDRVYSYNVKKLIIELTQMGNDRITVTLDEDVIKFSGKSDALNILGDSLINYFEEGTTIGDHFHLDYYEGNDVLNETKCSLIFQCDW